MSTAVRTHGSGPAGAAQRWRITGDWVAVAAAVGTSGVCCLIAWHIAYKSTQLAGHRLSILYTIIVGTYVLSRFALAACYRPPRDVDDDTLPRIAIVVPAFNEGAVVARTIDACMALNYPAEKVECVVVDDGSDDDTFAQMQRAAAQYSAGRVRCITLGSNQGKRAAMAAGIRATTAEVLVFVDSDSHPAPDAVRLLVQSFTGRGSGSGRHRRPKPGLPRSRVGAVSGISHVRNADHNLLTRMQAARYFVSFQLLKAAESTLGAVSCCSGCFSAYRREAVAPLLQEWEHQRFLGVECTYGDDRALTNRVIRAGWRTVYDSRAEAWTDAPTEYRKFFRQQLRWKKSWAREGMLLLGHVWRTRPIAFPSYVVATIAGLLTPLIMVVNLAGRPVFTGTWPLVYILGLYLVSMTYGLFHRAWRADRMWPYAIVGTFFYIAVSLQLLWALVKLRDGSWGTRMSAHPTSDSNPAKDVMGS